MSYINLQWFLQLLISYLGKEFQLVLIVDKLYVHVLP